MGVQGIYGKFLHLPLNSAINIKLLKIKSLKKQISGDLGNTI